MARITIEFNEEQITLIKNINFKRLTIKHEKSDLFPTVKYIYNIVKDNETLSELDQDEIISNLEIIGKAAKKSNLYAKEDDDKYYGVDTYDLFNSDSPFEAMSLLLGYQDKIIEGTETDYDGPKFTDDVTAHFIELLEFIITKFVEIEEIIHQRCDKGGIKPNVKYIAFDHEHIWRTEEELAEVKKKRK